MTRPRLDAELDRDQAIALAVAEHIASERNGGLVTITVIPEREDRTNKAVELVTKDAVGTLAIEHTRIEPYPDQIRDNHQIRPYIDSLPAMLCGRLPAESRFELNLDVGVTNGIKDTPEIVEAIAEWVSATAPLLEKGRPGIDGRHMKRAGPPEIPFPITLARWPRNPDDVIPQLVIGRWRPTDLEQRRIERVADALGRKLPKLVATAKHEGGQGVLILESNDRVFTNRPAVVSAAQRVGETTEVELPEWIVLWEQFDELAILSVLRADHQWATEPQSIARNAVPAAGQAMRPKVNDVQSATGCDQ